MAGGDVIGESELETVAAKERNHAVRNAFEDAQQPNTYDTVPAGIFTSPEVTAVGITELGYMDGRGTCSCRTVQMEDVPKAKAVEVMRGFIQVVKHHDSDEIVGGLMVGSRRADVIPEATFAVKFGLTVDDIIDTIHPFQTVSGGFKYACQAVRREISTMSCCVE